jgi:hypothetical protein
MGTAKALFIRDKARSCRAQKPKFGKDWLMSFSFESEDEALSNEALFGKNTSGFPTQFEQEGEFEWEAPMPSSPQVRASDNARGARILWPALGFPAVIAPRAGASSDPAVADAVHSIVLLVLTAQPLSKGEAARFLRFVPWDRRHQRSIAAGQVGSFSPQELSVRPIVAVGEKDDASLCEVFTFGGGASTAMTASLSKYVLQKFKSWGLPHLTEIRVSEGASRRLAKGQYNLFWNDEQPDSRGVSNEMTMLLDQFARAKQKYSAAWASWGSNYLKEYGFEYGSRYAPYNETDKDHKPVEVYHPLFVHHASESTIRIGHVSDIHVSIRSDIFERNLQKEFGNNGMRLPEKNSKTSKAAIRFNNWNRSFTTIYNNAKAHSDVILLTGDLIDYGRGHIGQPNSGQDLGIDANYHEDRNWFLFYYLLAGHDSFNQSGRYTKPVFTTLGNHDWRINPYPPFAPGTEAPAAFVHNHYDFDKAADQKEEEEKELFEIMSKAHGRGYQKEFSYNIDVNKHFKRWIDKVPGLKQAAEAYRLARTVAKVGIKASGQALLGKYFTYNLDIKGTPVETTPESIAWYLLVINPFLDYQFPLPGGHQVLMLDWSEDEEIRNSDDGKSLGIRAAKCLTSLQKWQVAQFLARPGKAKIIGIHMPPLGPQDWHLGELAAGTKSYAAGLPPKIMWESKRVSSFPLLAVAPEGFSQWLAASYGSFVRNRDWFVQSLAKPNHGVRLVFSGHIHRAGLLVTRPVTLKIPQKGLPLPKEYQLLKVTSVASGSYPKVQSQITGPLYVNTTSGGPIGVQNFRGVESYISTAGFSLARLSASGAVNDIWQGLIAPDSWKTNEGATRNELGEYELLEEFNEAENLLGV